MNIVYADNNLNKIHIYIEAHSKLCGCIRLDKDMRNEIGVYNIASVTLSEYIRSLRMHEYHVCTTESPNSGYYIYKNIRPDRSSEGCNQCPQNEDCCVESDDKPDFVMCCRHCTYDKCRVLKEGNQRLF